MSAPASATASVAEYAQLNPRIDAHCSICNRSCTHDLLFQQTRVEEQGDEDASVHVHVRVHQRVRCHCCRILRDRFLTGITDSMTEQGGHQFWESMHDDWAPTLEVREFTEADASPSSVSANPSYSYKKTDTVITKLDEEFDAATKATLPPRVLALVQQVEVAGFNRLWHLWTMGMRMLLEAIVAHFDIKATHKAAIEKARSKPKPCKCGEERPCRSSPPDLCECIDYLYYELSDLIPQEQRDRIKPICERMHIIRLFGNDAAHSLEVPPSTDCDNIWILMNELLRIMFSLPEKYEVLAQQISDGVTATSVIHHTKKPKKERGGTL